MPVAIIGAVAAGGIAWASAGSIAAVTFFGLSGWEALFARVAVSFVISELGSFLSKPKTPSTSNLASQAQERTQQLVQAIGPSETVYGDIVKSGTLVYASNTDDNKFVHLVIVVADHEIAGMDETIVNSDVVPPDYLDADGNVIIGKYAGYLRIRKHLGGASQAADALLVGEDSNWTEDHRLQGRAYLYIRYKRNQQIFPGAPNFSQRLRAKKVFDSRTGVIAWTPNIALISNDWLDDDKFGIGVDAGNIGVDETEAAGNACEEMVDTQPVDIPLKSVDLSTDISKVNATTDELTLSSQDFIYGLATKVQLTTTGSAPAGLATGTDYFIIPGSWSADKGVIVKLAATAADAAAGTAVNITSAGSGTHTLVKPSNDILTLDATMLPLMHCDLVHLVTAGTPPAGLSTGTDYYVIPYQYMGKPRIKLAATMADALANDGAGLSIPVTDAGSGDITIRKMSEPRYFGGGVLSSDRQGGDCLKDILTSMCGRPTFSGGVWRLYAGVWRGPSETMDEDDLRGVVSVQTKISRAQRFNTVIGTYISPANNWQPANYPQVRNQTYIDADMGDVLQTQVDQPFSQRGSMAQRIAKIKLDLAHQEIVVQYPAKLTALQFMPLDTLYLNNSRMGWSGKIFEVQTFSLSLGKPGQQAMPGIDLMLQETASTCYDWDHGQEIAVDPAPNTDLPNPFFVTQIQGLSINSIAIATKGGDTIYRAVAAWDAITDAFVIRGGFVHFAYRLTGATSWVRLPPIPGDATQADIFSGQLNTGYDLQAWLENSEGLIGAIYELDGLSLGSSGGVGTTNDWGSVADSVGTSNDWGSAADPVGTTNEWGGVA